MHDILFIIITFNFLSQIYSREHETRLDVAIACNFRRNRFIPISSKIRSKMNKELSHDIGFNNFLLAAATYPLTKKMPFSFFCGHTEKIDSSYFSFICSRCDKYIERIYIFA